MPQRMSKRAVSQFPGLLILISLVLSAPALSSARNKEILRMAAAIDSADQASGSREHHRAKSRELLQAATDQSAEDRHILEGSMKRARSENDRNKTDLSAIPVEIGDELAADGSTISSRIDDRAYQERQSGKKLEHEWQELKAEESQISAEKQPHEPGGTADDEDEALLASTVAMSANFESQGVRKVSRTSKRGGRTESTASLYDRGTMIDK